MENETVSKNFIEQEIDKDLAEGVYSHVQTRAEWIPSYWSCEVYPFELWTGREV